MCVGSIFDIILYRIPEGDKGWLTGVRCLTCEGKVAVSKVTKREGPLGNGKCEGNPILKKGSDSDMQTVQL